MSYFRLTEADSSRNCRLADVSRSVRKRIVDEAEMRAKTRVERIS
ncbi:MAG: hypothetical protein ACYSWR_03795 [Planctomycetota bacterium]